MQKREGISKTEVIVLVCVLIFFFVVVGHLTLTKLRRFSSRVVCGTNLKGLGTAMTVYANDYDDECPKLGKGPWSKTLGYSFEDAKFKPYNYEGPCTITSSLYMLVRETDVSPRSFVCTEIRYPYKGNAEKVKPRKYSEFEGTNSENLDIVELWDFGPDPYQHVAYAYHNPYGRFSANIARSASFALMADMNPWFDHGRIVETATGQNAPQIIKYDNESTWKLGNTLNHESKKGHYSVALNVVYADGHTANVEQPNVGVRDDNIYTFWSAKEEPTEQDIQGGTAPTSRSAENDAKSRDDSFLAI